MSKFLQKAKALLNTELILPNNLTSLGLTAFFSKKTPVKELKPVFFPKQVHGTTIKVFKNFEDLSQNFEADGTLCIGVKGFVGIKTADCVPILLASKDSKCFAAIHAGWRGSLNGILKKGIEMILSFGYSEKDIFIAIGPHIKVCCYEVKEDVLLAFKNTYPDVWQDFFVKSKDKIFLDLLKVNLFQAKAFGIPEENVWISKDCTFCTPGYASFRRDGNLRLNQLSVIGKDEE